MSSKKDLKAYLDLNKRAGGLLTSTIVNGQKRYQRRRDLPVTLQLELDCLRRRSKKRLKKLRHLVVFARKNRYHLHEKLDTFDLHRAVESLLLHIIKSLSALNSLQIISRFAAFLLAQFKTTDIKKPRRNLSRRGFKKTVKSLPIGQTAIHPITKFNRLQRMKKGDFKCVKFNWNYALNT
jgi:hypothetical protein